MMIVCSREKGEDKGERECFTSPVSRFTQHQDFTSITIQVTVSRFATLYITHR